MKKRCLVIETHSDDSCISSAGFLEKYKNDYEYYFHILTCSSTFLYHSGCTIDKETRLLEYVNYCNKLGGRLVFEMDKLLKPLDYDTKLDSIPIATVVQNIELALFLTKPDLLIVQGPSFHQDHAITYKACIAALRPCGRYYPNEILVSENPTHVHHDPTQLVLKPNLYVELTEDQIENKIKLFYECFPSQRRSADNYLSNEGIRDWARYRGIEARCEYAEAFYQFSRKI